MSCRRILLLTCLFVFVLAAVVWASAPLVSDQIAAAVALPDGAGVVLDAVYVESVIGGSACVRDTWAHSQDLLVSTDAAVQANWTVKVTGQMTTIDGQRVLVAASIQLYATIDGGPAPPLPACMLAAMAGVSLVDVPEASRQRGLAPSLNTSGEMPAFNGTIERAGKIITGVFYDQTPKFFYIQEPDRTSGIKVIPSIAVPLEVGNIVTVKGTVVCTSGDAEAYISAGSVECTGSQVLPNEMGMAQRQMVSGAFGIQPALYSKTSDPVQGTGLSAVGSRVRVWGSITSGSGNTYWLDDGSGLKSTVGTEEKAGVRLVFSIAPSPAYTQGQAVQVTGILGAEMSDDSTALPVPVVRIPASKPATSHVWYVRPSPAGNDTTHTGDSWGQAFATVQKAITTASSGDEVWAAQGTYTSSTTVTLKDGVAVYGGFTGTASETRKEQRNWTANVCTLKPVASSGNFSVITAPSGISNSSRVDGFTITGGYGNGNWTTGFYGGGINCTSSSPTIVNNIISGNTIYAGGGGNGAGIACTSASPTIWNNTIVDNRSYNRAGGIYCSGGAPVISGNSISRNSSYSGDGGSGIYCTGGTTALIACNSISQNFAYNTDNPLSAVAPGIGIYCTGSSPTITRNRVFGNVGGSTGGGIYCYGGSPTIASNAIIWNAAQQGSGIYCTASTTALIANNTIAKNITTSTSDPNGGGICVYSASPTIANNIIAFNPSGIYKTGTGTVILSYNDLWQNTSYAYSGLTGDSTDKAVDPGFAGIDYGDIHIAPSSGCVDAVLDDSHLVGAVDIDGQARIQGTHLDIGADESDGSTHDAAPVVVYVSPSGNDQNDGLTWGHTKRTIQTGIYTAARTGGEVWVQAATYGENIKLQSLVGVYGGFVGTEDHKSQRNFQDNVTVIDGGNVDTVAIISNVVGVVTVLDGFTLRNGRNTGTRVGGVYCFNTATVAISNNTVTSNTGIGIYCQSCSPIMSNNKVTNCSDAGIYCQSCSPIMSNNTVSNNLNHGVWCSSCTTATISGNTISANQVVCDNDADEFDSDDVGAGIFVDGGTSVCISHNVIGGVSSDLGNAAPFDGGGICCRNVAATADSNLIEHNTAGVVPHTSGWLTGWYGGGGLALYDCAGSTIQNNVFAYNVSTGPTTGTSANCGGGAIYAESSAPTVVNNTFIYNGSGSGDITNPATFNRRTYGGAVHLRGSTSSAASLVNNIFYGNLAPQGNSVALSNSATATVSYCDAFPDPGGPYVHYYGLTAGSGCLYVDPLFTGTGDNPYWLQSSSPVRGQGLNPGTGSPVPAVDKDGRPRPGTGNDNLTDMGAYEDNP